MTAEKRELKEIAMTIAFTASAMADTRRATDHHGLYRQLVALRAMHLALARKIYGAQRPAQGDKLPDDAEI